MTAVSPHRSARWTDVSGVVAAIVAALCCAGTPLVLSVLGAIGLGWVRRDAILWPLMFVALAVALWSFWSKRRAGRGPGPALVATIGAAALVAGVVFVHGPLARQLIDGGAIALVAATLWSIFSRRAGAERAAACP